MKWEVTERAPFDGDPLEALLVLTIGRDLSDVDGAIPQHSSPGAKIALNYFNGGRNHGGRGLQNHGSDYQGPERRPAVLQQQGNGK